MKNLFIILLAATLFISCEMKKYENDTDSFSEIPDITEEADIIDNDVEADADGTEDTCDIDDETPDEDYSDVPCGSVYFNGVDSYISVEHNDALNLGKTWTIEAWVMQDSINGQNPIIRKGAETGSPSYWIYGKSSDMVDGYISTPNGGFQYGTTDTESFWLQSRITMSSMNWFHVALSKSESQTMLFVNGILQKTVDSVKTMHVVDENLYFGARLNDNPSYFAGLIDEVRFSSTTRYLENFTPEKRLEADNATIAVWHFEEDKGTETTSEGANILKGILNGSAEFVKNCNFSESECDNDCFKEGETRCSEGVLQTCWKNNSGCLEYINEACSSKVCADKFICEEFECLFEGMSECKDGKIRVCYEDDNGILKLSDTADCNGGACADESSCLSKTSECEYIYQTRCSDGKQAFCKKESKIFIWSEENECSLNECKDNTECKPYNWEKISAGFECRINSLGELFCSMEKVGSRTDWTEISGLSTINKAHTCAIAGGELFCMGNNNSGQLGDGTTTDRYSFVKIGNRTNWTDISVYIDESSEDPATCGIAGGELLCWGASENLSPQKIGGKSDWETVTGSCGISSGKAYCWDSFPPNPKQIGTDENWEKISSKLRHVCAVKNGELFCWGNNNYGQLGDGTTEDKETPVKIGSGNDWTHISTGLYHTCGIAGKKLFCWGENRYLQLGINSVSTSLYATEPTQVDSKSDWTYIDSSTYKTCGIEGNDSYCWGAFDGKVPERYSFFSDFEQLSVGYKWICGINENELFCSRTYYEKYTSIAFNDPAKLSDLSDWTFTSAGYEHVCAIRSGELYCWGDNNSRQVGNGTYDDEVPLPEKIGNLTNWETVNAGTKHTCGIESGELYCWGKNSEGQLGDNTTVGKNAPEKIGSKSDWISISVGTNHTCGIAGGKLFCWGDNSNGKLGIGSTDPSYQPVQVGARTDWEKVVINEKSSCGIASGELLCWGLISQSFPELHSPETSPVKIHPYNDFTDLSLNESSVCGLRKDKHLYCWDTENLIGQTYSIYPEMISDIKWKTVYSNRELCGVTEENDLICPLAFKDYFTPVKLINP